MRHPSYLLLAALVAGATAKNIAQSRQSVERDNVALNSRDATEISQQLVEARIITAPDEKRTVGLRSRQQRKRDDDDPYDEYLKDQKKHLQELQQEQEQQQQQDDDDDDDKHDNNNDPGPPRGPPGGTIAGAVIGVVVAILIALALWFFLRIRPRRKQRQLAAAKEAEINDGYAMTPVSSSTLRATPPTGTASNHSLPPSSSEHIRWAPTPYPERAPSIHTGSSMSGLALPTPALTYSPSVGTSAASPPSPPEPRHHHQYHQYQQQVSPHPQVHPHFDDIPSEKPPSYDAITALQSSEPQPEASAYQLGQVPVEPEPEPVMCHVPVTPQYGVANSSGEHMPRY
ncbi:uncharacterized protein F4807DRAFT_299065 [Annulohypoxylon truncatum]|uniref:uncharacterized protein n=1 Tax=Annulohypoxylon truncatum TaxID=327061 RepID=UPI002007CF3C|nr:uncharacterized protein F4807DRAFT_299065 [Annulohypoxylon truncatum]KAI1204905.1 hypothetical protein F4807DRAFT_299065 [Annulohypoxylon truncatum]